MKKIILLCIICSLLGSIAIAKDETKTYPDGSKYIGQIKDGKRDGEGTLTWPDGRKYSGQWENDKFMGQWDIPTFNSKPLCLTHEQDGWPVIICLSEDDALLVLNGHYNLPDTFLIIVILRGIYLEKLYTEDPELTKALGDAFGFYKLRGTKLTDEKNYSVPIVGMASCKTFYNLNRNINYYVTWKIEKVSFYGISRMGMLTSITDKNGKPIPQGR